MHSNGICTLPCLRGWSKMYRQPSGCHFYLICSPLHQRDIPSFQHHQMRCQCWGIVKKIKWKFFCAFENARAEKWDTLNSFNFQPDKLLPQHAIMFQEDTKLSFACTHTDIVSTPKWVTTSLFHVPAAHILPCLPPSFTFQHPASDDAFDMTVS